MWWEKYCIDNFTSSKSNEVLAKNKHIYENKHTKCHVLELLSYYWIMIINALLMRIIFNVAVFYYNYYLAACEFQQNISKVKSLLRTFILIVC